MTFKSYKEIVWDVTVSRRLPYMTRSEDRLDIYNGCQGIKHDASSLVVIKKDGSIVLYPLDQIEWCSSDRRVVEDE